MCKIALLLFVDAFWMHGVAAAEGSCRHGLRPRKQRAALDGEGWFRHHDFGPWLPGQIRFDPQALTFPARSFAFPARSLARAQLSGTAGT